MHSTYGAPATASKMMAAVGMWQILVIRKRRNLQEGHRLDTVTWIIAHRTAAVKRCALSAEQFAMTGMLQYSAFGNSCHTVRISGVGSLPTPSSWVLSHDVKPSGLRTGVALPHVTQRCPALPVPVILRPTSLNQYSPLKRLLAHSTFLEVTEPEACLNPTNESL
jgi:hypothetical protein